MNTAACVSLPDHMGVAKSQTGERDAGGAERAVGVGGELVERLRRITFPGVRKVAWKLQRCMTNEEGWRCGSQACPRCSRKVAIKHRRSIERRIAGVGHEGIGMFTATINADTLEEGLYLLRRGLLKFRRRKIGSWMAGGAGAIEFTSSTGAHPWLVHVHQATEARGKVPTNRAMTAEWEGLIGGLPGRVHWSAKGPGWSSRRGRRFSRLAFYVTKRRRSEWLALDDDRLAEAVVCVSGRQWGVRPFGTFARRGDLRHHQGEARRCTERNDGDAGYRCGSKSRLKTLRASRRTSQPGQPRITSGSSGSSACAPPTAWTAVGFPCRRPAPSPETDGVDDSASERLRGAWRAFLSKVGVLGAPRAPDAGKGRLCAEEALRA